MNYIVKNSDRILLYLTQKAKDFNTSPGNQTRFLKALDDINTEAGNIAKGISGFKANVIILFDPSTTYMFNYFDSNTKGNSSALDKTFQDALTAVINNLPKTYSYIEFIGFGLNEFTSAYIARK